MKRMLLPLALAALPAALTAQGLPDDLARLDVLPGWRMENGNRMVGFRITLAPGWKTYWRAPGDAGIPPLFAWNGSENVEGLRFHWPVPEVFDQAGMRSIGYESHVTIPVEILSDPGAPLRLAGSVDIGVCDTVCVPVALEFDLAVPEEGRRDPQIVAALIDRPMTAAEAGVQGAACRIEASGNGLAITASIDMPPVGRDEAVVIEPGNAEIWVSEPETRREGNRLTAEAQMVHVSGEAMAVDRSDVRITVLAGGEAVDIRGCAG